MALLERELLGFERGLLELESGSAGGGLLFPGPDQGGPERAEGPPGEPGGPEELGEGQRSLWTRPEGALQKGEARRILGEEVSRPTLAQEASRGSWNGPWNGPLNTPRDERWTYPLSDGTRRCFSGYLKCPFEKSVIEGYFRLVRDGTEWTRPETGKGRLRRKTAWMVRGSCKCAYPYGGVEVRSRTFPPWMEGLVAQVMPHCGLGDEAFWPNSCNLNLYEDGGASVGWHADDEDLFRGKSRETLIVSLSLGATRRFEMRARPSRGNEARQERISGLLLHSGDVITMEGMFQRHYQHRVPEERDPRGPRINLTWRWIVEHGPGCPYRATSRSDDRTRAPDSGRLAERPRRTRLGAGRLTSRRELGLGVVLPLVQT